MRQHLGDQEHLVAAAGDGLADHLLGDAVAVHLRGVDVVHAEIEAAAQRRHRDAAIGVLDVPGALADHRHVAAGGSEAVVSHRLPPLRAVPVRREAGIPIQAAKACMNFFRNSPVPGLTSLPSSSNSLAAPPI